MSGSYPNEKYDARKKTINVYLANIVAFFLQNLTQQNIVPLRT